MDCENTFSFFVLICRKAWKDNSPPSRARKSTKGGLAISLSACEDDKMAIDTTVSDPSIIVFKENMMKSQLLNVSKLKLDVSW